MPFHPVHLVQVGLEGWDTYLDIRDKVPHELPLFSFVVFVFPPKD